VSSQSDHDRVLSSGAWFGLFAGSLVMCWIEYKMPAWAAYLLTWAVVLPVTWFMARWKDIWYAWITWWGLVALCVAHGFIELLTPWFDGHYLTVGSLIFGQVFVGLWYWMIRIPRKQPAPQPQVAVSRQETHVYHHVIHHGQQVPGWTPQQAIPAATVTAEVLPAGAERKAIEAPRTPAKVLTGVRAVTTRVARTRNGATS
jgi:hypothetical protein